MTLALPKGVDPPSEPQPVPEPALNNRSLSDLEEFIKHMRIYGQSGYITILIGDVNGNTYGITGFDVSLGIIKIGRAL